MKRILKAIVAGICVMIGIELLVFGQFIFTDWQILIVPFGASTILLFGIPDSPLAKPLNVIGGHVLTAAIGLIFLKFVGVHPWSFALAMGVAVSIMIISMAIHPPAGANPILLIMIEPDWMFLIEAVLLGATSLVLVTKAYFKVQFNFSSVIKFIK